MNKMSTSYQTELWGCEAHNTHDVIPERLEQLESSVMVAEKPCMVSGAGLKSQQRLVSLRRVASGVPELTPEIVIFVTICMANCSWT